MGILSYGALAQQNKLLQAKVDNFQNMIALLKQETNIQSKVIGQLQDLLELNSSLPQNRNASDFCDKKHFMCKINHGRFTWTNQSENRVDKKAFSVTSPMPKKKKVFSFRRLSKRIDLLQAKYGMPSCQSGSIMVASAESIHLESSHGLSSRIKPTKRGKPKRKKPCIVFVPRPLSGPSLSTVSSSHKCCEHSD